MRDAESARSSALQVELGGQAIEQAQQASLGFATVVGIAAAIMILLLSFGSFSAMVLPIATALFGLGAGPGDQRLQAMGRHARLRLRAGADDRTRRGRRLLLVHRHAFPGELPHQRRRRDDAVKAAINTSGRAVVFAGVTVVIALLGMFALGVTILNGAAVAAAIGVVLVLRPRSRCCPRCSASPDRRIGASGRRWAAGRPARIGPGCWRRWVGRARPTGADRDRGHSADARARRAGARPAPGLERRRQRSVQQHHAQGL